MGFNLDHSETSPESKKKTVGNTETTNCSLFRSSLFPRVLAAVRGKSVYWYLYVDSPLTSWLA